MKIKELKIEEMVEINGGRGGRGFFDRILIGRDVWEYRGSGRIDEREIHKEDRGKSGLRRSRS